MQSILLFFCLSQIGIDVEEKTRKTAKNILSLARRYFTPSEIDYLAKIPDPDAQQKEFVKLWTLKVSELS
jgi:4'-phosphopantetheinyl transferase